MEEGKKTQISIKTTVKAPVAKVWKIWTDVNHIKNWNNASEDWLTTFSENDLRIGGKFLSRMEAKDGSEGFDFYGIYDEINLLEVISYTLGDERKVKITFKGKDNETEIVEIFEAEHLNTIELQQKGWQAILDNFKKYAEQTTI